MTKRRSSIFEICFSRNERKRVRVGRATNHRFDEGEVRSPRERRAIVDEDDVKSDYRSTAIRLTSKKKLGEYLALSWEHLTIVADVVSTSSGWFQRKERVVLSKTLGHDLCGHAGPGQIVAIMGSSGAGLDQRGENSTRIVFSVFFRKKHVAQCSQRSSDSNDEGFGFDLSQWTRSCM